MLILSSQEAPSLALYLITSQIQFPSWLPLWPIALPVIAALAPSLAASIAFMPVGVGAVVVQAHNYETVSRLEADECGIYMGKGQTIMLT